MPPDRLPHATLPDLVRRVHDLLGRAEGARVLLGISGAPGAGKTTLAVDLVAALAADLPVAHLPMDGFHLADAQLDRLDLRDRKGAPETFDAYGYLATLRRLRSGEAATVYVPGFERALEQPVAAAIAIPQAARVVVSEGNYLLLDDEPWPQAREVLDEVWYLDLEDRERLRRLVARHTEFGKAPDDAQAWALGPDQANAERIVATRDHADLVLTRPG